MAYSVSHAPEIRQDLKNGATFECHKNSVFRVHANILVVSRNGSVESCVREKVGGREWEKKKSKATPIFIHDWKFVKISTFDSQASFPFSKVYVVQVPVYMSKKWLEEFQTMITKLLTEADKDTATSITIPLLGTNAGGAPKDGCVERVMDAVFKFPKFKSLRKIKLVVQGWSEVTQIQDLVAKEKLRQKSDAEYKNITQNIKKTHLFSSSKSQEAANGPARSRARSPDKGKPANRFDLSDRNSHSNRNGAKGDNSYSHNSTSSSSSSSSRYSPTSDPLTFAKSRPDSVRDGGGIHDIPGFDNNRSSAPRNNEVVGAEGSPVDPATYNDPTRHGNHSRYQEQGKELQKNGGQLSYAKVVTKNNKGDSDHKHISNRDYTRPNNAEDEEFSPEYAAAHKDSDHRNVSEERHHNRNSSSNNHNDELLKINAKWERDRLQELEEIENQDKHNKMADSSDKEELGSRHQNGNFNSKTSFSYHQVKEYRVSLCKCSYCQYSTTSIVELPCHHIYCYVCVPHDNVCPQCEIEEDAKNRKKRENGAELGNRGQQKSSQQAHEKGPENRSFQRNEMVDSSREEDLESGQQNGNFDSVKSISNNNVKDMGIEKNRASDKPATTETGRLWCKNCKRDAYNKVTLPCCHVYCIDCAPKGQGCPQCEADFYAKCNKEDGYKPSNRASEIQATTKDKKLQCSHCLNNTTSPFELSCGHVFCIYCEPDDESCPQCKVDDEKSNKKVENSAEASNRKLSSSKQTHGDDRTKVSGKYHCKSCLGYTVKELMKMPCSHFCCVWCSVDPLNCQQCKVDDEKSNKKEENSAEASNRILSSSEQTNGDFKEYYCKSCFNKSTIKLSELPCHHFCCFHCFNKHRRRYNPQKCQQCEADLFNKENGAEASNTVPNSKKRTNGDGQDKAVERKCHKCDSSLVNNSPVQLGCGHTFCAKCASEGCNDSSCNKEHEDNRDQVPSSSHGEGRNNAMEEKCHGCDASLANTSSVQQANGHTLCAKCVSEGCNEQSSKEEHIGIRDQVPSSRERTHEDDHSNGVRSSSQGTHEEGRDSTKDKKCMRCKAKDCNDPSCNEKLKGNRDPRYESSGNKDEVYSSREEVQRDARAKTADPTCSGCKVNLKNNSPVQLGCGHTFCARCASKGCKDPSCEEDLDYDPDDINPKISGSNQDQDNHSNSPSDTREHDRDTRINDHSTGSDGNYRDRHRSRDRKTSDFRQSSKDRHRSSDRNGSGYTQGSSDQKDSEYRQSSIDRKGSRYRQRSSDRNGSYNRQSSRDRNGRDYRPSSIDRNGSELRHRSSDRNGSYNRQSSRDRNGRDYRSSSRDRNGSELRHRSSDRNGRDYRQSSRDRMGSDRRQSSRDRNGGEGQEAMPKHAEIDQTPKETCAICMDDFTDPKKLHKCGHVFCRKCIDDCFKLHKPVCPSCGTVYGVTIGNMPPGTMDVYKTPVPIEGFKIRCGSYCINYHFSDGIQRSEHPNPGASFRGTTRTAYLPASPKGVEVCKMLKVAFKRRLTFTIGRSTTTGRDNVVTWNDIHHKTSMIGGPTQFGYPDPTYLTRVKEELASKGVTPDDIHGVKEGNEYITM